MSSDFPAYIDGKPPVISLEEYDEAKWAAKTAVDSTKNGYVAVDMNDSTKIVAVFNEASEKVLDEIFKDAKAKHYSS